MNISFAKVGMAMYAWTAWFGKRSHAGSVYADEVKRLVGDGEGIIACCADNTSSNTSMTKGLFGQLSQTFTWFYIGCCVHAMDLLCEDIAKLDEIASAISECKFIVLFVIRYPMLYETFLELQKARRKANPRASMVGLKTFPDTRFAYAYFMIYSVYVNWSCLVNLVDTSEFKLMKTSAKDTEKSKRRSHFLKFENLVGSNATKKSAEAAVELMSPISSALHYLEGDNVDSSHVMAVFVTADQNAKQPSENMKDAFDADTLDSITSAFSDRWNGAGRKVGIKHEVHCLAFKVDIVLRYAIELALGAPMLVAIESSYRRSAWDNAINIYSKGNDKVYTDLVNEMTKMASKSGEYAPLHRQAEALAKQTVAHVVAELDEDTKNNKLKLLIALLAYTSADGTKPLSSRSLWGSTMDETGATNEEKLFAKMAKEVLSIVTQACAVERINKSHGWIHSKARASMSNPTTRKALYCFTNESLVHKLQDNSNNNFKSFEAFIATTADATDASDILSSIAQAPVGDYLPAGSDKPPPTRRADE